MNDKQIDRYLSQLEKAHRNDLKMIQQFRMDYFETDYLEELYEEWQMQRQTLKNNHYKLFFFALTAPIWIFVANYLGDSVFALPVFLLFPITIFTALGFLFALYAKYGSPNQHHHLGNILEVELIRRRDPMYI
ncbi:MAG: hypothetical protein AAGG68_15870 [Bacteroidota bacterium]